MQRRRPRVLVVAGADPTGAVRGRCRLLRREGVADARAFTVDLAGVYDGGQELCALVEAADALHFIDVLPAELPDIFAARIEQGPSVVLEVQHTTGHRRFSAAAAQHDWALIATRPDVVGARFVPPFVAAGAMPVAPLMPGTRARIRRAEVTIFAGSATPLRANPELERLVDAAEAIAARVPQLRVDSVSARPHRTVLQRQRWAHLAVCSGLSELALAALAQGVQVVADVGPAVARAYADLCAQPPPVVPTSELDRAVMDVRPGQDPDLDLVAWAQSALDHGVVLEVCADLYCVSSSSSARQPASMSA